MPTKKELRKLEREAAKGKDLLLGIDENNNGFGIHSNNPNYPPSMIVAAYLEKAPFKSANQEELYGGKKGAFGGALPIEEVLMRAKHYLTNNNRFVYTHINHDHVVSTPMALLKARAIAVLTLGAIFKYSIDPSRLQVVIDEMDGNENSQLVGELVKLHYEKAQLKIPFRFVRHSETHVLANRRADRTAYNLAAIHFRGTGNRWPHRHRKVDFHSLEKLTLDFLDLAGSELEP